MNARQSFRADKDFSVTDDKAGAKPLSSGDKSQDKERVAALSEEIAQLQNIFYAEHTRKLLIVLQGMDTSGKDGTIGGVFGRVDPLGIRCVAFKAPTPIEQDHDYLWRIHR